MPKNRLTDTTASNTATWGVSKADAFFLLNGLATKCAFSICIDKILEQKKRYKLVASINSFPYIEIGYVCLHVYRFLVKEYCGTEC